MRGRPALGLTKESLATFSLHSPMSRVSLPPFWGVGDWPGAPWELVAGQHGTVSLQCLSSPQSTVSRGRKEAAAHHTPRRQAGHKVETRGRAPQVSGLACGWLIRVCLLGHGDTEARFLPGTLPRDTQLTRRAWGPRPPPHQMSQIPTPNSGAERKEWPVSAVGGAGRVRCPHGGHSLPTRPPLPQA